MNSQYSERVALLRGVNVGGANKISMRELCGELKYTKLTNVRSFLNSGSLIYRSKLLLSEDERLIKGVIGSQFNLEIAVLSIASQDMEEIVKQYPWHANNYVFSNTQCILTTPPLGPINENFSKWLWRLH